MQILAGIGIIALGILQVAGFMAGLEEWFGLHWVFTLVIVIVVFNIPFADLVIPVVAFFGFKDGFGWEWWQAALAAAPGFALMIAMMMGGGIVEMFRKVSRS